MISIPIMLLSIIFIITGKMPLFSGKVIEGNIVRLAGIVILSISVCSLFFTTKMRLILIALVIPLIAGIYFFVKVEDGEKNSSEAGQGGSFEE